MAKPHPKPVLRRIVSGGQTGVDRRALDAAIDLGLPHGGWCPRGRLAEDGPIPSHYCLSEMPSADYAARTRQNVLDSDGTLVLCAGPPQAGTALTCSLAKRHSKPCLVLDLAEKPSPPEALAWLHEHAIANVNVAGPRESSSPGIGAQAYAFIRELILLDRQLQARSASE